MILFPAIDVLDNRAVRLLYGKRDMVTDYGYPQEMAERWSHLGAEFLHLVDLNGAFDSSDVNHKTIKNLIKNLKIPVQIGGGIKSFDKIKFYLEETQAERVIVGSSLVKDKAMIEKAVNKFGNKIVAGIDVKDNKVAIKGWVEEADVNPLELAFWCKELGIDTVVYTDITRDGALTGVNYKDTKDLSEKTEMNIIASGGMSSYEDINLLKNCNIYGAILGRAIYNENIDLIKALQMVKKC